jgi:hypothetical protein
MTYKLPSKPEKGPDTSKNEHTRSNPKRRKRKPGSQEVSVRPTLYINAQVSEQDIGFFFTEFHMTIVSRISNLTQKQASMLLSIANCRAIIHGVDISLYLSMKYLYELLVRSGHSPEEIKNHNVQRTVLIAELLLSSINGEWHNLRSYEKIPQQVVDSISSTDWLPSERTLNSWKQHWDLEKYLAVRIVHVEQFQNRNSQSLAERYSGYTKGYGQDGNTPAPGKTRPSPELDGEDVKDSDIWPETSVPIDDLNDYLTISNLILKMKQQKRKY